MATAKQERVLTEYRRGNLARTLKTLEKAIGEYGEAQFACGEWDRNESDEKWSVVFARAEHAKQQVAGLLKSLAE